MMNIIRLALLFALLFTGIMIGAPPVQALLPQHSGLGCLGCHNLHGGSAGGLLTEADSESTCLSCHGLLNPFGITEVAVHDPVGYGQGSMGYITCRECHNPHDNIGSNIKLIGYAYDPETGIKDKVYEQQPNPLYPAPGEPEFISVLVADNYEAPAIRVELSTSDINNPVYRTVTFADVGDFNIDGTFPGPGVCQICHAPNHNVGADCSSCHPHDTGFKPKGCTSIGCHDGLGAGALAVSAASSHSTDTIFTATGVTYSCADCHSGHNSGTIEIPNNLTVGINYGSNGENGIALGSSSVTGATEAEICWNCHGLYSVSEWGVNTETNGSFPDYNFGSLNQDNWVGATWTSANFQYKTDLIQSTHAANVTDGVAGVDVVGDIRCSYCHDVHDLNAANGDTLSGSPYLRGSWMGNPYREDGAPRWDLGGDQRSYNQLQAYGAVPRGNRDQYSALPTTSKDGDTVFRGNEMGGYWIDQNSGFPTQNASYDTAEEVAGLCELCHGGGGVGNTKGDGVWAADEIDNIDQFTPNNNWMSASGNGHANSVIGGSGASSANANNIFTNANRGNPVTSITAGQFSGDNLWDSVGMGYFGQAARNKVWGIRNNDEKSWFWSSVDMNSGVFPPSENPDGVDVRYTYGNFEWGNNIISTDPILTQDNSTIDDRYHQFTCSKCHNPHASRLPRLMISNCLDVRNNTWDNQTTFTEAAQDGTTHNSGAGFDNEGYSGDTYWAGGANGPYTNLVQSPGNQELAYAFTAQNCHRAVDATTGWNTITPPNSPSGAWP